MLSRAVRAGLNDPAGGLRLRAFRGTTLDYRLLRALIEQPLRQGREVQDWVARIGGRRSCIALNGIAEWDLELGAWFSERLAELQEVCSVSLSSRQDTYAFISGGTGWTPFGIHQDHEPSLLLHLGPSPKRVWIWEGKIQPVGVRESVAAFSGVSFHFDASLPAAREVVLQSGDILNVPAHAYHVFHNDGRSAFLGLAVHLPNPARDTASTLETLGRRAVEGGPLLAGGARSADRSEAEFRSAFQHLLKERQAELSSMGFVHRPAPALLTELPPLGGAYRLAYATAVTHVESTLFVRGRRLRTNMSSERVARVCAAMRELDALDHRTLANEAGLSFGAAERILAAVQRLGGLVSL